MLQTWNRTSPIYLCIALLCCFNTSCIEDPFRPPSKYEGCCNTTSLSYDSAGHHIFIANAISPNADGINDAFSIYSKQEVHVLKLSVAEQHDILAINRSNIKVKGNKEIWSPINASGQPIHGLFHYELLIDAGLRDTLRLSGEFCAIDCMENDADDIAISDCVFDSFTDARGEIDTSKIILENNCDF